MRLIFKGELGDNQSWGISTIGNVQGFLELGHTVTLEPTNLYGSYPLNVKQCIKWPQESYHAFIRQGLAEHMEELRHIPRPIRRISLACWDSDLITAKAAEIHNSFADGVIALSEFTAKAFRDAGVTIPIHVGGQGIDPKLFYPPEHKIKHELIKKDTFDFLFVGVAQGRKGTGELIQCFEEVFKGDPKVRLIVKSNSWGRLNDYGTKYDNVVKIYKEYSREQLAGLYRNCDCFILPTHGDSFMLPGLEAMACGLPLVITDFGGPRDYCTTGTGYPIKYTLQEAGYLPGHQAIPDLDNLREVMHHVFTHQGDAQHKGMAGAMWAASEWTWKKDATKIVKFLENLDMGEK